MNADAIARQRARSERVSPTAYATGYFWYSQGMGPAALAVPIGRVMHYGIRPLVLAAHRLTGLSLDAALLARHRGIDERLTAAIDSGRVTQVIELAAGLSPRGSRFVQRYGERIRYIETDLPHMTAEKQRLLGLSDAPQARHRIVTIDALADSGPQSLSSLVATLDPSAGLAIITEGLMNYFDPLNARRVWRTIATTLAGFADGLYLSDAYLADEQTGFIEKLFLDSLSRFVRGRVHLHFRDEAEAQSELRALGFKSVQLHRTRDLDSTRDTATIGGADRVRILEAS